MSSAIFILGKDFYNEDAKFQWELAQCIARIRWDSDSMERFPEQWTQGLYRHRRRQLTQNTGLVSDMERWAIIQHSYKVYLKKFPKYRGRVFVLINDCTVKETCLVDNEGIKEIHLPWTGQVERGHLIWKTIEGIKWVLEQTNNDFDYIIRSTFSGFISLPKFDRAIAEAGVGKTNVHIAPFWDSGTSAYGAFNCISKDLFLWGLRYPDPRWYNEPYPDDAVFNNISWACNAWKHSDKPYPPDGKYWWGSQFGEESKWKGMQFNYDKSKTYWNAWGFSCSDSESVDSMIEKMDSLDHSLMFFLRCNDIGGRVEQVPDYVKMYKKFLSYE